MRESERLTEFDIPDMEYCRVGLEAGSLSQHLYAGLAKAEPPDGETSGDEWARRRTD